MRITGRIRNIINAVYNRIMFCFAHNLQLGNGIVINGRIKIPNTKTGIIQLGNNVRINSGKDYNIIGGDTRTNFVIVGNGKIVIGNGTGISNSTLVAQTEINIGEDVKIGGSVKIYDTDFHSIKYKNRVLESDSDIKTARVVIKDGAFIGSHTIILKGVTIGARSVVGAGSVVTKNIPDEEIWAGNPAVMIRKNID